MMTRWGDGTGEPPPFLQRAEDAELKWRPKSLPGKGAPVPGTAAPSQPELEWLRRLAAGARVADLAHRAGLSERTMFRRLHDLYQRMRVHDRTEALSLARERGWL
ncbi:response regulator transcription factor [Nonomuraea typhae]|uniref:Response regulator transcription factor n=1 Tax=Nonomuraea typhae TaxID=2603600 RepID=A0ABW7Z6I6_9ACTN